MGHMYTDTIIQDRLPKWSLHCITSYNTTSYMVGVKPTFVQLQRSVSLCRHNGQFVYGIQLHILYYTILAHMHMHGCVDRQIYALPEYLAVASRKLSL